MEATPRSPETPPGPPGAGAGRRNGVDADYSDGLGDAPPSPASEESLGGGDAEGGSSAQGSRGEGRGPSLEGIQSAEEEAPLFTFFLGDAGSEGDEFSVGAGPEGDPEEDAVAGTGAGSAVSDEPRSQSGPADTKRERVYSLAERGRKGGLHRKAKPHLVTRKLYLTQAQDKKLLEMVGESNRKISSYLRERALGPGAADEAKLKELIGHLIRTEESAEACLDALAQGSRSDRGTPGIEEARIVRDDISEALTLAIGLLKGLASEFDEDEG